MNPNFNIILNPIKNLRLFIQRANNELPLSLLVGIGLRSAHTILGKRGGRVGFRVELFELNK